MLTRDDHAAPQPVNGAVSRGGPRTPRALPAPSRFARLDHGERPILTVVIDTEEEFDWSAPHDRDSTGVAAMNDIHRIQAVLDEAGIKPCYVVDYAVASQETGYRPLRELREQGRCSIGAHLHPWVNPPFEEVIDAWNSYPGNLPEDLERRKLEALKEQIERVFGSSVTVYKAGRYGVGPSTGRILEDLAFEIDVSPLPAFDFSADGGPNFEAYPNDPWWFGAGRPLLCVPGTGALVGPLGRAALPCYRVASAAPLRALRIPGVLSRLRLVDRLRLSPEGYTLAELERLTRFLYDRGTRVFSLGFHSPSARPGCTPYVQSVEDRDRFLELLAAYFEFFAVQMNGMTMSPEELRDHLLAKAPPR